MEPVTYVATIEAPSPIAEAVAARLEAAESPVAMAVTLFECGPDQIEVSAHYAEKPARERLIQLIDGVAADGGVSLLRIEQLPAKNWVAEAESLRGPVRAGRFLVHGRHDRGKVPAGRFTLEIDAGLAFGTAHHATTRGCLIALDRLLKRGSPGPRARCRHRDRHPRHRRRQGSRRACDCERHGPGRRRRRYRKRFEERRSLARPRGAGRGLAHPALRHAKADLLFANLLLRPLLELAPAFARVLRPGGMCVLSGILDSQARQVEARFRALGFKLDSRILLDGWTTLLLRRGSTSKVPAD